MNSPSFPYEQQAFARFGRPRREGDHVSNMKRKNGSMSSLQTRYLTVYYQVTGRSATAEAITVNLSKGRKGGSRKLTVGPDHNH